MDNTTTTYQDAQHSTAVGDSPTSTEDLQHLKHFNLKFAGDLEVCGEKFPTFRPALETYMKDESHQRRLPFWKKVLSVIPKASYDGLGGKEMWNAMIIKLMWPLNFKLLDVWFERKVPSGYEKLNSAVGLIVQRSNPLIRGSAKDWVEKPEVNVAKLEWALVVFEFFAEIYDDHEALSARRARKGANTWGSMDDDDKLTLFWAYRTAKLYRENKGGDSTLKILLKRKIKLNELKNEEAEDMTALKEALREVFEAIGQGTEPKFMESEE